MYVVNEDCSYEEGSKMDDGVKLIAEEDKKMEFLRLNETSKRKSSQSVIQTNTQTSEEIDDHIEIDTESTNDKTDKKMKDLNSANSDTLSGVTA